MKQFLNVVGLIAIIGLLMSCEKAPVEYNASNVDYLDSSNDKTLSLNGKWLLISGRMYLHNLDDHIKTKYDHFDSTSTSSSMKYGGSTLRIEELYQDSTTWEFNFDGQGYGVLILNGDSTFSYNIQSTSTGYRRIIENQNMTIPPKMRGNAKPFLAYINDIDNKIINVIVNESEWLIISGHTYSYHNILQFKKI